MRTAVHNLSHPTRNPPMEPTSENLVAVVDSLREVGSLFYQRGWSVGTSSNYSVVLRREPLELLITASGKDKGRLTPSDFVRVDDQGVPVAVNQPKSSAETLLHVEIAKRLPVGAVLHTHSVWGTLVSDLYYAEGGVRIEGYEMLKGLDGITTHETGTWIEIFANTQDIPALAEQVGLSLADPDRPAQYAFLIRNHGLYTWGRDLEAARRHVEILEFLFEVVGRRVQLPTAAPTHVVEL